METWAYQFIPALVERYPECCVQFYGARPINRDDATAELEAAVAPHADRFSARFFVTQPGRVPQIFSLIWQFAWASRRQAGARPELVIAIGTFLELLLVLIGSRTRRSFKVVWLRTIWVDQKTYRIPSFLRPLVRWVEARILHGADLILANGSDIRDRYAAYGLKVEVIRNAVDIARWQRPAPVLACPIRVAFVGRLAIDKGIGSFVELARKIAASPARGEFSFEVFGHLAQEAMVRTAANDGVLIWHGAIANDQLPEALAAIDVCVALTFSDPARGGGGTSNAMMEQMASGRIMLAWDNPIFQQWLSHDNAYLAPQGDVAALAERLGEIHLNPAEARRRAANGMAMMSGHGIEAMMTRFDKVLNAAMT